MKWFKYKNILQKIPKKKADLADTTNFEMFVKTNKNNVCVYFYNSEIKFRRVRSFTEQKLKDKNSSSLK